MVLTGGTVYRSGAVYPRGTLALDAVAVQTSADAASAGLGSFLIYLFGCSGCMPTASKPTHDDKTGDNTPCPQDRSSLSILESDCDSRDEYFCGDCYCANADCTEDRKSVV